MNEVQRLKDLFDNVSFKRLAADLNLNPWAISYWMAKWRIPKKYKQLISNYLYAQSIRMRNAAMRLK